MIHKKLEPITVAIDIKADLSNIFRCFTMPTHIVNWNFATDEWCCPKAENDLKPNGKFSWRMEAKDGSMGFDFCGIYKEVIENELITYTMEDGRLVIIKFKENNGEVTVSETFEAEGSNSDEMQRAGWQAILHNFKHYVESFEKRDLV